MNYYLLGYVLTKKIQVKEWMNTNLLPEAVVTISDCIADIYPHFTIQSNDDRHYKNRLYKSFQVNYELAKEINQWLLNNNVMDGYYQNNFFSDMNKAMKFKSKFFDSDNDILLLGVFVDEHSYKEILELPDFELHRMDYFPISQGKLYNQDGKILGYDVYGPEYNSPFSGHCSLCTSSTKDILDRLGYDVNNYGLYKSIDEVNKIKSLFNEEEIAEPVHYLSTMIVKYDINQ